LNDLAKDGRVFSFTEDPNNPSTLARNLSGTISPSIPDTANTAGPATTIDTENENTEKKSNRNLTERASIVPGMPDVIRCHITDDKTIYYFISITPTTSITNEAGMDTKFYHEYYDVSNKSKLKFHSSRKRFMEVSSTDSATIDYANFSCNKQIYQIISAGDAFYFGVTSLKGVTDAIGY